MRKKTRPKAAEGETVLVKLLLPRGIHRQVKSRAAMADLRITDQIVELVRLGLKVK